MVPSWEEDGGVESFLSVYIDFARRVWSRRREVVVAAVPPAKLVGRGRFRERMK